MKPVYDDLRMRVKRAQSGGILADIPTANLHYLVLGAAGLAFSQAAECKRVTGVDPRSEVFADAQAEAILRVLGGR